MIAATPRRTDPNSSLAGADRDFALGMISAPPAYSTAGDIVDPAEKRHSIRVLVGWALWAALVVALSFYLPR